MKLVKAIIAQARYRENDPAVAFPGGVATFGGLLKATAAAVDALRTFDLAPGTAVMIDIRNPIHHLATIYALALLGLPSASVGTTFAAGTAGFVPPLFLTDRADATGFGTRTIRVDERWFATAPGGRPDYARLLSLPGFASEDDVVRYVFSSGTTGHPKCVGLTAACLEQRHNNSRLNLSWWMLGSASLNMLGFSTIAGISVPLSTHVVGQVLCFAANYVEALQMLQLFHVSSLVLSTGQLDAFFKIFEDQPPPPSLRVLAIVGAKLSQSQLMAARAKICSTVVFSYGSTEAGAVSGGLATSEDNPDGFAGRVHPWVTLEVVDEERRPVALGVEGELRVRTPELAFHVDTLGARQSLLVDGWYYPGDRGILNQDSRLVVVGRTGEAINRGGVVVAPDVVEDVLRLDRTIKDVAVVGVLNTRGIEEIWAAVVSDTLVDPKAVIEAARSRLNEKVPDRVIQVEAIPRAESAKIKRGTLRDMLIAKVGRAT